MTKMKGFLRRGGLLIQFSHVNLKLTVITLIGLTIGLSMISAVLIQLDSIRADYYIATIEEFQDEISIKVTTYGDISSYTANTKEEIHSQVTSLLTEVDMENFYQLEVGYPYSKINYVSYGYPTSLQDRSEGSIVGLEDFDTSILNNCVENSQLPSNIHEVILLIKNSTIIPVSLNEQFNVSIFIDEEDLYHNVTFTAVGLVTSASLGNNSILNSFFEDASQFSLLTSFEEALIIAQTMNDELETEYNRGDYFSVSYFFTYAFNLAVVPNDRLYTLPTDFYNLLLALWRHLNLQSEPYVLKFSFSNSNIATRLATFEGLFSLFLFFSLPVLLVAALLGSFSLGLINEQRKKSLAVIKARGVSDRFIFLMMFFETGILAITTVFFALFIGLPLSLLLGASSGLLRFNRPIDPSNLVLTPRTMLSVFYLSGVLTFLLHLPSLYRLSRSVALSLAEMDTKRTRGRFRVALGKLDIICLTLGSAGVFLALVLTAFLRTGGQAAIIFGVLLPILTLIMLFSPLVFFLGFFFYFSRFVPVIIKKIGVCSWQRNWLSLSIATRNLHVSAGTTGRITILIASSLALMVTFAILAPSLQLQSVDNAYYTIGGEISYSMSHSREETFLKLVTDLKNVTGFSFTTIKEFELTFYEPDPYVQHGLVPETTLFMGIEEDFADFAHWQEYYDDQSLAGLVDALFDSGHNNSAIIDSTTLVTEQLTIGDSYTLKTNDDIDIPLSIQAASNYWPRMVTYSLSAFVIAQTSFIENIAPFIGGKGSYRNTLLGKILPGHHRPQVISEIRVLVEKWDPDYDTRHSSSQLQIIDEVAILQADNISNIFAWFVANTNVLAEVVMVLSAIILFTITRTIRHTQEIALARSLGMKSSQVFRLVLTETFLLVVVSGILGTVAGCCLLISITAQFALLPAPPGPVVPLILSIDFFILIGLYVLVFFVTIVIGLVSSIMTTRANISKILKAD